MDPKEIQQISKRIGENTKNREQKSPFRIKAEGGFLV